MQRKVFIVDDHPIVREGLAQMVRREPDLAVCGAAEDAPSALQMIEALKPDILIVDISLHGPDGLDLLKSVRAKDPMLPVLILSMHDESIYAERALRAGANGYIMKQEATENVLVALRRILNREVYVSPRIANKMLQRFVSAGPAHAHHSFIDELSDRELEVLRLMGEGHGTRQIADELHLSVKTVETYQAHLKEKLALRNSRELVQYAIQWMISTESAARASEPS
ncbi:MAG: response regulator transcription factor [Acidobacteriaceae bacterium]|nr:response regulator transcription factor [Acidobacteriaceae bacterium]